MATDNNFNPGRRRGHGGLYTQFGCANVSQFCKKIVHGEIEIAGANVNVVKPEPICTKEELKELQAIKRKYESICRIINT